ncbi:MAG: creatininase family protein [Gemmatimonadota bacterium]|nr:MAG: creatininase family protein [Gemmatimonadota bacterium]
MAGRPYVLAETTWKAVRETDYEVAVLPWGATEAHNYHLPYGADIIESEQIAIESARLAWESGAKIVVLPTVPFGVNTQQLDITLTLNLNPSTQAGVLEDLVRSLDGQGIPKLVILNGHGGNDFRQIIRELQPKVRIFLCTLNWYTVVPAEEFFEKAGDHAGELETSLMLHLAPNWVLPLSEAGAGRAKNFRIRAFREGWAWTPRHWTQITSDTGVGEPSLASAEKGHCYYEAVTQKTAEFLVELAAIDLARLYDDS